MALNCLEKSVSVIWSLEVHFSATRQLSWFANAMASVAVSLNTELKQSLCQSDAGYCWAWASMLQLRMTDNPLPTRNPSPSNTCYFEAQQDPPSMPSKCANPALQKHARAQPMPTRSPVPNTGCHREAPPCRRKPLHEGDLLPTRNPSPGKTYRDPTKTTPACHSHAPAQPMHTRKPVSNKPSHEDDPLPTRKLETLHPAIPSIREPTKTPPPRMSPPKQSLHSSSPQKPATMSKESLHEDDPLATRNPSTQQNLPFRSPPRPPQHVTHLRKPCTPEARRNPPPCRKKPFHDDDALPTSNPSPSNTCHSGAHQDPPQHVTRLRKPCPPEARLCPTHAYQKPCPKYRVP